jgi:hypothetical protein
VPRDGTDVEPVLGAEEGIFNSELLRFWTLHIVPIFLIQDDRRSPKMPVIPCVIHHPQHCLWFVIACLRRLTDIQLEQNRLAKAVTVPLCIQETLASNHIECPD